MNLIDLIMAKLYKQEVNVEVLDQDIFLIPNENYDKNKAIKNIMKTIRGY